MKTHPTNYNIKHFCCILQQYWLYHLRYNRELR